MKNQWLSKFSYAFLIVMLAVVSWPVTPARAAAIAVNVTIDEDAANANCSLREAIIAANTNAAYRGCTAGAGPSDTITLASGSTYTLTLMGPGQGDLDVTSNIIIQAGGATVAIIDPTTPAFNERVFDVSAAGNLTLDTIQITTAITANAGAAINNAGVLTVQDNSIINNNSSNAGGGGGSNGGGIASAGTLTISNTAFTSNSATNNGGAIFINGGTATITSSTFNTQNAAAIDDGAAIYLNAGTLSINGTTFTGNATTNGGGGAIFQNGGTLTIGNTAAVIFTGNTAINGDGGAINVSGGTLTVSGSTFNGANSAENGGAIFYDNNTLLTVTNSTFNGNTSINGDGGAIMLNDNGASASISGGTFISNSAEDDGGAVFHNGGLLTVTNSTFQSNRAGTGAAGGADGGAIRITNQSTNANSRITLSTFMGNSITMAAAQTLHGGAIANDGRVIIANVTFSGNTLTKSIAGGGDSWGGAIYANGNTTVHNSTFSGNTVAENGTGAASGGSIYGVGGRLTIANSIVAGGTENGAVGNCGGTITNGGNNIDYLGGDCGFPITDDPNLGTLTGSPSPQFFPLNTPSSAIDAGSNTICANATSTSNQSQNGLPRPQGAVCDIGSYEALPNTAPTINSNGGDATANISVTENTTAVTDVDAADTDLPAQTLTYSISGGADQTLFSIVPATGVLTFTAAPNFENPADADANNVYEVTVQVSDGALTDTQAISVTVINANESPSITSSNTTSIAENITAVMTVVATDPDAGTILTYSITGGADQTLFSIVPATGVLTFTAAPNFEIPADADFNNIYDVTVQVSDGTLANTQTIAVTVNNSNETPILNAAAFSIDENSANSTAVGTVTFIDPDAGQTHTFAITGGNIGDTFAINTGTGQITVVDNTILNFETNPTFNLAIQVTDNGTPGLSGTNTITVNLNNVNEVPVVNAAAFSVDENSTNGTAVGTAAFTDPDAGQTHTFAITAGNTDSAFAIDAGGQITVANTAALDFETNPTFSLAVQVTDNGTPILSGSNIITISLNNVNEMPIVNAAAFAIDENSANSTAVGTVTFADADAGQTHTFAITAGNTGGAFAIDTGGQITIANTAALDFETDLTFSLTVQVTDNGTPSLSGANTIAVNLNDVNEAPVVNAATFLADENSTNGTAVGTVTFTDPDAGQTHTFAITAGNTGGAFAINASGQITVANTAALDFETNPAFSLTVQVTDNGTPTNLSDTGTITINLNDVNDAPLVNTAAFAIDENSANSTAVGTVTFTDPDAGQTHTFAITGGNTGGAFAINASGQIAVANTVALDFETNPTFTLTVEVTDNGTPSLSGTNTITINLNDVNEVPVVNAATFAVDEDSANGTAVGSVTFTDPDAGQTHTFDITAGNTGGAFAIGTGGQITVANTAALNFEINPTFSLTVRVTDNGTPSLSATNTIVVDLNNVNETPIVNAGTFALDENSVNGLAVGTVTFTDPDAGQTHAFTITAGNTGGAFAIGAGGQITIANAIVLDFETAPAFNLTVQVTDNGTPNLSGTNTITINLNDVNEAPAVNAATFTVDENSANGTAVGMATFADPDDGQTHTFAITAGNTGGTFAINTGTGQITVADNTILNFETNPTFSLTVQVTDNGTPNLSGTNAITINLNDVNEVPVVNAATFAVDENSANGTAVGTVTFTDPDAGQTHTFAVTAGNTGGTFAINVSGQITVADNSILDFETNPTFTLTVQVTDNGTPSLSATNTIIINLNNVNDAPVTSNVTDTTLEDTERLVSLSYTDAEGNPATSCVVSGLSSGSISTPCACAVGACRVGITPDANSTAQITADYTVDDGATSNVSTITLNVTTVNDPPFFTSTPVAAATQDALYTYNIVTHDPDTGDTLTITASTLPSWLTLISTGPRTATLSGTPSNANIGNNLVVLHLSDGVITVPVEQSFTIIVGDVNDAPVFTSTPVTTAGESTPYTYNIVTDDLDVPPDTLTITAPTLPSWLTLTDHHDRTATLNGTPDSSQVGGFNVALEVADGALTATQTFRIVVSNTAPQVTNATVNTNPMVIRFNQDVFNPPDVPLDPHDVTNPANYLLVRDNGDDFQTTGCDTGADPLDTSITINTVTYSNGTGGKGPFVATVTVNGGLPLSNGNYRLFVCGTTSIVDIADTTLELAGNGAPGTDYTRDFTVAVNNNGNGNGNGRDTDKVKPDLGAGSLIIPVTGFAPDKVTALPPQPADKAYKPISELRIEIPSLGVNFPIVGASISPDGWDLTWLQNSVAYLEGSAYPTLSGNTVLTAHVADAGNDLGPFSDIKWMKPGHKIYIHFNGQKFVYQVQENRKISPSDISTVFKHENYDWITLVTCEDYNTKNGLYKYRRMVRAVLISVVPEK